MTKVFLAKTKSDTDDEVRSLTFNLSRLIGKEPGLYYSSKQQN